MFSGNCCCQFRLHVYTNPPKTTNMMDEISNALRSLKMPGMAHYWTTMQETRQHDSLSLKDGPVSYTHLTLPTSGWV